MLCCFGAGGHGKVVASQWARVNGGNLCFGDEGVAVGTLVAGFAVRFESVAAVSNCRMIVTIGDNELRRNRHVQAAERGLTLETFIAEPQRFFGEAAGPGTVVLAGAIVNRDARLGQGVIVNSGAVVEHDCVVDDFAHLAPNCTVGGGCRIGAQALIGAGATILPQVEIAAGAIVGAGAVVVRSVDRSGTYIGAPARLAHRQIPGA
jgi:sugar O-acyltransferase (sialic acid O-acetyltransferase NeuD family)